MTSINISGDGIDLTLSRLTPAMFLRLMANVDSLDPAGIEWDFIESKLLSAREYSNSNPILGQFEITINCQNQQNLDEVQDICTTRDVGERGNFYLLGIAESNNKEWHTIETELSFEADSLLVEYEHIRILGIEELSFVFLESVRHKDEYSESRDASRIGEITCFLIDDSGHVYSLSDEITYAEAWRNRLLENIAIQNLTKLIERRPIGCSVLNAAKALRGKLYLLEWLSKFKSFGSSDLDLLSSAREDLEAVKLDSDQFEEYLYESKQFLSSIYGGLGNHPSEIDKAILCLSQALEGQFAKNNARFSAETFAKRAGYYALAKKPALAIKDYKEAILRYELLGASDKNLSPAFDQADLADCKLSLGLLMQKFGGNFVKEISEAIELNPDYIHRILQNPDLSKEQIDSILSSEAVSRETLNKVILLIGGTRDTEETKVNSDYWSSHVNLSTLNCIYNEIEASKRWFQDYGVNSWALSQLEGNDCILLSGQNFKTTLHLLDGYIALVCGFSLVKLRGLEHYAELHALLAGENAEGLMSSVFRVEPDFNSICFERHIWTQGWPTRSNVFTQIVHFVQEMETFASVL